ncbi:3-dehydroquinate synthase [bacterium]|nr:3-dehydroquinate synthase [bacterium]
MKLLNDNYYLGSGALKNLGAYLIDLNERCVLVIDENVSKYWNDYLLECVEPCQCASIILPSGEGNKNFTTLNKLYDFFVTSEIDRSVPVVICGGGVLGVVGGLAAATFLRGVPLVNVPTTLLAMVDSSVGGKNGIDLAAGKNLVGSFYEPKSIWADSLFLNTLPTIEISNGMAEVVKCMFLDAQSLTLEKEASSRIWVTESHKPLWDEDFYLRLIEFAVRVKFAIVRLDPFDRSDRYKLNLGHTFAHSLEVCTNYHLTHGQAVSIGLSCALNLARRLKILKEEQLIRMKTLLELWGLPTCIPECVSWEDFFHNFKYDKKREFSKNIFILPVERGKLVRVDFVSAEDLHWVFEVTKAK